MLQIRGRREGPLHTAAGWAAGALIVMVGALGVVACGDDGDGDGNGGGQGAPSSTVEAAKASIEKLEVRPTEVPLDPPIEGPIPEGKTIAFLRCGTPACTVLQGPFEEAARTLDWNVDIIDAGLTPQSVQAAWNQTVRTKPDGVFYMGFPRTLFERQLQAVAETGAPIVAFAVTEEAGDGITHALHGIPSNIRWAEMKVDWVIADTDGDVNVVQVIPSEFPIQVAQAEYLEKYFKKQCPQCPFDTLKVSAANIGKSLPTEIVGYLRSHPDVNYIIIGYDDMITGVPGALQDAQLSDRVKIVGQNQSPQSLTYIANGEMAATLALPGPEIMWRGIDVMARTFADEPVGESDYPYWVVTQDTAESFTKPWPIVLDYQEQYRSLWNK